MLRSLRIKNLALVTDLALDLEPGYNAITGETGAGKSIIIGAINLLLGERADRSLIRSGADSCTVEAVFTGTSQELQGLLEENGIEPCEQGELLLKRVFTAQGTNRQFINGSPTTLSVLARLGEDLVDMHGPHDHQSLLQPARQLAIVDAFGQLSGLREAYREMLRERARLLEEKRGLIVDEQTYAQQLDLLRHQVHEIKNAQLNPPEEEELEAEHRRMSNAARLLDLSQTAANALDAEEGSALERLGEAGRALQELTRLDPGVSALNEIHRQTCELLNELKHELDKYIARLEPDPRRLQQLEERIGLFHSLKRKYGRTLADVAAFGQIAAQKLAQLEQRESELARIDSALGMAEKKALEIGTELSSRRQKIVPKLAKAVTRELMDLGFKQSQFQVSLERLPGGGLGPAGLDQLEFQLAPNPGEPAKPLRAIASSGEMARVMLALKTVLASVDSVPVLVFDEVDANVGGETASVVGARMARIGENHQVLCITHLAPVAAAAPHHYLVSKNMREGRTVSEISLLNRKERVDELARMLGGGGEAARKLATALLDQTTLRKV